MSEELILRHADTKQALVVNKLPRDIYDELSATSALNEKELYFITDQPYVAIDISAIGKVDLEPIEAELSSMSIDLSAMERAVQDISAATDVSAIQERLDEVDSQLSAVNEQMEEMSALADYIEDLSAFSDLSAIEAMVDGKRDYSDLSYDIVETSSVAVPFEVSAMAEAQTSAEISSVNAYRSQMIWRVQLASDPGTTYELEYHPAHWDVDDPEDPSMWGGWWEAVNYDLDLHIQLSWDDSSSKFFLDSGAEDAEDLGVPQDGVSAWTVTLQDTQNVVSLTMPTRTIEIGSTSDTIALRSELSSYVPSSDFSLSGLGCSTIEVSGTYEDDSTFSYQFVIQEANQ